MRDRKHPIYKSLTELCAVLKTHYTSQSRIDFLYRNGNDVHAILSMPKYKNESTRAGSMIKILKLLDQCHRYSFLTFFRRYITSVKMMNSLIAWLPDNSRSQFVNEMEEYWSRSNMLNSNNLLYDNDKSCTKSKDSLPTFFKSLLRPKSTANEDGNDKSYDSVTLR